MNQRLRQFRVKSVFVEVKPDDRKKYDESNDQFQKSIPRDKWPLYTIDSGTSEATPQVTRAATQIVAFLRTLLASRKNPHAGDPLFSIEVPKDRFTCTSRRGPRLTGDVESTADPALVQITYRLVEPWKMVKQILMDSATPMPEFSPSAVGAGFVDPNYIERQFPTPEKTDVQIESIKVL